MQSVPLWRASRGGQQGLQRARARVRAAPPLRSAVVGPLLSQRPLQPAGHGLEFRGTPLLWALCPRRPPCSAVGAGCSGIRPSCLLTCLPPSTGFQKSSSVCLCCWRPGPSATLSNPAEPKREWSLWVMESSERHAAPGWQTELPLLTRCGGRGGRVGCRVALEWQPLWPGHACSPKGPRLRCSGRLSRPAPLGPGRKAAPAGGQVHRHQLAWRSSGPPCPRLRSPSPPHLAQTPSEPPHRPPWPLARPPGDPPACRALCAAPVAFPAFLGAGPPRKRPPASTRVHPEGPK